MLLRELSTYTRVLLISLVFVETASGGKAMPFFSHYIPAHTARQKVHGVLLCRGEGRTFATF